MINPSTNGWVDKYFKEVYHIDLSKKIDGETLYENISNTGLAFGYISRLILLEDEQFSLLKTEEVSKLALLEVLYLTYNFKTNSSDSKEFISVVVDFYNQLNPQNYTFLKKIINPTNSSKLEKIIENRIQTSDDLISKKFSIFVTNSLLFIDVLAFEQYLKKQSIHSDYCKKIEELLIALVTLSLQIKINKSTHDDLLIKFFESSIRYTKFSKNCNNTLDTLNFDFLTTTFEKFYLIDIAIIALLNDLSIENNEIYFLQKLGEKLSVSEVFISKSIKNSKNYIQLNKSKIPYFSSSKSIKNFYDQTNNDVVFLIKRNKKRLIKEISQSKELMILLSKSTTQELTDDEKKKIKTQLLDICKTIPSLTLFLLPGGGLLLPLLVKFIPQLLPSAFNENLEKNES